MMKQQVQPNLARQHLTPNLIRIHNIQQSRNHLEFHQFHSRDLIQVSTQELIVWLPVKTLRLAQMKMI